MTIIKQHLILPPTIALLILTMTLMLSTTLLLVLSPSVVIPVRLLLLIIITVINPSCTCTLYYYCTRSTLVGWRSDHTLCKWTPTDSTSPCQYSTNSLSSSPCNYSTTTSSSFIAGQPRLQCSLDQQRQRKPCRHDSPSGHQ